MVELDTQGTKPETNNAGLINNIRSTAINGVGSGNKERILKELPKDITNRVLQDPQYSLIRGIIDHESRKALHIDPLRTDMKNPEELTRETIQFFKESVHIDPDSLNYPWDNLISQCLNTKMLSLLDNSGKKPIIYITENMTQKEIQPKQQTPVSEDQMIKNWEVGLQKDTRPTNNVNPPVSNLDENTALQNKSETDNSTATQVAQLQQQIKELTNKLNLLTDHRGINSLDRKNRQKRTTMRWHPPPSNNQKAYAASAEKTTIVVPSKTQLTPQEQLDDVQRQLTQAEEDLQIGQRTDFSPDSDSRLSSLQKSISGLRNQQENLRKTQKELEINRLKQELEYDEVYFGIIEPHLSNMEKARLHGDILWRKHQLKNLQKQPLTPPFTEPVTEEKPLVVKRQPPKTEVVQPQQKKIKKLDIEPPKKVEAEEAIEDIILDPEYFMRKDGETPKEPSSPPKDLGVKTTPAIQTRTPEVLSDSTKKQHVPPQQPAPPSVDVSAIRETQVPVDGPPPKTEVVELLTTEPPSEAPTAEPKKTLTQRTSRIRGLTSKVSGLFKRTPQKTAEKNTLQDSQLQETTQPQQVVIEQPKMPPAISEGEESNQTEPTTLQQILEIASMPYDGTKNPFVGMTNEEQNSLFRNSMREIFKVEL